MAWDKLTAEDIESWDDESGPFTPLLDSVNYPVHMKNFNIQQLQQLCKELRADVVHNVSKTGGHLSSSLGVVELTVALHYVFNAPEDKMIWDVGHQCYIHKMLTGRRKQMKSIRQTDGLSGARPPALDSGGGGGGAHCHQASPPHGAGAAAWHATCHAPASCRALGVVTSARPRSTPRHPPRRDPPTTAWQASPSALRASTTPSARVTAAPASARAWAWRSAATPRWAGRTCCMQGPQGRQPSHPAAQAGSRQASQNASRSHLSRAWRPPASQPWMRCAHSAFQPLGSKRCCWAASSRRGGGRGHRQPSPQPLPPAPAANCYALVQGGPAAPLTPPRPPRPPAPLPPRPRRARRTA